GFVMACLRMLALLPGGVPTPPPSGKRGVQTAEPKIHDSSDVSDTSSDNAPDIPAWDEVPNTNDVASQDESEPIIEPEVVEPQPTEAQPAEPQVSETRAFETQSSSDFSDSDSSDDEFMLPVSEYEDRK